VSQTIIGVACARCRSTVGVVSPDLLGVPAHATADDCIDALSAQLASATAKLEAIDAACLKVCADNTEGAIGTPDPDVGRYLTCNENGDEIIDTDEPAVVIVRLFELWAGVSGLLDKETQARVEFERRATEGLDVNWPMPDHFLDYVVRNYPPDCRIGRPAWHAPKLWRAAMYALVGGRT